jgi:hypothetical protein
MRKILGKMMEKGKIEKVNLNSFWWVCTKKTLFNDIKEKTTKAIHSWKHKLILKAIHEVIQ